ncbi:MAG: FAD-dependent oxidoreductase [Gemmatimonadaceae bacterium]|nr:FAD-dependent oxidoreductase [Gemmatimonadaceae bacterium]
MTSRRDALRQLAALAAMPMAAPALAGLSAKGRVIRGGFAEDHSTAGHALRDGKATLPASRPTRRVSVAIVGGGIGGLSAGWQLDALGVHDWVVCELGARTGGNAQAAYYPSIGQAAPWGAHYLPVPAADATYVRALLRDLGVLGADGRFDERTLCHTPQERIFQHGRWHEGLEPFDALPPAERAQFTRFAERIAEFRATRAFAVPSAPAHERRRAALATVRQRVEQLDAQTADAWLTQQGFTSKALRWWVEYGTRDDYGASLTQASAWAAVHYFAAREADEQGPLTWPEGNDWIAQQLTRRVVARRAADDGARLLTNAPALRLARRGSRWVVDTPTVRLDAEVVIWSAPLFVLPRVAPDITVPVALEYAPWVVANLVLDRLPAQRGSPLAWDNVLYDSPSLGYVNAAHQHLGAESLPTVWTWYHAVVDRPATEARRWLQARPWSDWRDQIVADLARAHPDIASCVARIDVMRWGHAMARPTPGLLSRTEALARWQPAPGLLVAHADLSGFSLFEEAQWHGVRAAEAAASRLGSRKTRG